MRRTACMTTVPISPPPISPRSASPKCRDSDESSSIDNDESRDTFKLRDVVKTTRDVPDVTREQQEPLNGTSSQSSENQNHGSIRTFMSSWPRKRISRIFTYGRTPKKGYIAKQISVCQNKESKESEVPLLRVISPKQKVKFGNFIIPYHCDEKDVRGAFKSAAAGEEGGFVLPTGLSQTHFDLTLSRSRRSRNSVYSIDPSLLERPGRIKEINSMSEFKDKLEHAKDALVCVTFSAKWCGPWRMIKPDVHRLSHIHGDVEFYEIDVDDNEEIAEARRVACMPTFQFFKRGIMLDKFAEPNRIKLDETIRKLRKMEVRTEE